MTKQKSKRKITGTKIILKWLQLSIDQALTIAVWVLVYSVIEPYVTEFSLTLKGLVILLLIIILQRDIGKSMRIKK